MVEESKRSNNILNQSNTIESLSNETSLAIKEQVCFGEGILKLTQKVNNIIRENRELTLKISELIKSIKEDVEDGIN